MKRSTGRSSISVRRLTDHGLSALLQTLLQLQLVVLGGYDGPDGGKGGAGYRRLQSLKTLSNSN